MGKSITIECEADIFIDEYVSDISDKALADEFYSRMAFRPDISKFFQEEELIELLISKKNILDASKIREFFESLNK